MALLEPGTPFERLLSDLEKIATIVAVVVGGLWVWLNTVRGRLYRPRLQVRLSGTVLRRGSGRWLLATIEIENKGLRRARFTQQGTGLTIALLDPAIGATDAALSPVWSDEDWPTFSVRTKAAWETWVVEIIS